jgi:glutathione S-transferase
MKLYDLALAPSPRRVCMILAEKGLEVTTVQVNLRELEQFGEAFQAVSRHALVPVLELDHGTRIGETVAVWRYFEAALAAHPPKRVGGLLDRD